MSKPTSDGRSEPWVHSSRRRLSAKEEFLYISQDMTYTSPKRREKQVFIYSSKHDFAIYFT
jgi:hypothetical protein